MKKDRCQISTRDFKCVLAALHNSENISPLWDFQAGIIHPASRQSKDQQDFVRPTQLLPCEILQAGIIHPSSQSS